MAARDDRMSRHRARAWVIIVVSSLAVLIAVWGLATWLVEPGDPPSFYDPPRSLAGMAPGEIIRSEAITPAPEGAEAQRILYVSTDAHDDPIAVSGVIFVPTGAAPAGGRPIVGWAHGTTGVDDRCAPSLVYPHGGAGNIPELTRFLAQGAIVVTTDYPGLGTPGIHPYLVGVSEGRAVLDSIRAARALTNEDDDTEAVVYGHSQGGHAVLFAAELADGYAPDVDLVGAAAMAPPTDLAALMTADQGEAAGVVLTSLAITSWSKYYPDTHARDIVKTVFLPAVADIGRTCIATNAESLPTLPDVLTLRDRFLRGDPTTNRAWHPHFVENSPATPIRDTPLLVAQGLIDDLVRPDVTERYVAQQCSEGANVTLAKYPKAGHFSLRTIAAPDVAEWMIARLDGEPATSNCP
jgi:pimeloyl-ACP methyl ester carboxylesterase